MPGLKNQLLIEKQNYIFGIVDPLGVVLGWSYGCLMVALGWS